MLQEPTHSPRLQGMLQGKCGRLKKKCSNHITEWTKKPLQKKNPGSCKQPSIMDAPMTLKYRVIGQEVLPNVTVMKQSVLMQVNGGVVPWYCGVES